MAVISQPKLASQFWSTFFKKTIILIISLQTIISLSTGVVLTMTGVFNVDLTILWIVVSAFLVINILISIILVSYITNPTKQLLAAVIHISDEKPQLQLPDINSQQNQKSGLNDALQIIYKLASSQTDPNCKPVESTQKTAITDALDITPCGFIIMNDQRQIVYSNKSTPIDIDKDGKKSLSLLFNNNDSLNDWLDKCENNSVHNEHIWTRVPDRLPNIEGRRFFDVIASYQKGVENEVVLTLIDRTNTYKIDEENLDFMSFAAHELRGPITVIRGYLDVLQDELDGVLVEDQKELFRRLTISANRLSGYINNILNTSKYDRRHLKVRLVEGKVSEVYDTIRDDLEMRAKAQNRLLAVDIPENLPTIAVDSTSMGEVFGNLIDNAIKYSNEGGVINVTAKVNGDNIDVSIEDHGIGMPENVVNNLFQKFYRSYRSRESVAGTGIGLYISKAIVESHGGIISVHSEDSKGSIFTVSIPIYSTVADKLKIDNNSNQGIISEGRGWIKNHSMYRG